MTLFISHCGAKKVYVWVDMNLNGTHGIRWKCWASLRVKPSMVVLLNG